ncbi:MAG: hypothetical protein KGJ55_00525 [Gammaproteobacteria bacterium]|nr:hypothetical protein [Gammaproteobacteria bacterium]
MCARHRAARVNHAGPPDCPRLAGPSGLRFLNDGATDDPLDVPLAALVARHPCPGFGGGNAVLMLGQVL